MVLDNEILKQACGKASIYLSENIDENNLLYFELSSEYVKSIEKIKKYAINKNNNIIKLTVKIIIIAAIIITLAISGIAILSSKDFFIEKFNNYSSYFVNKKDGIITDNIEINYIPDGFNETYRTETDVNITVEFQNQSGNFINITKQTQIEKINIDTEHEETSLISKNNINYTVFGNNKCYGIIWNTEKYVYTLNGNISKKELLKIAENLK